jgi:hypothetical protein
MCSEIQRKFPVLYITTMLTYRPGLVKTHIFCYTGYVISRVDILREGLLSGFFFNFQPAYERLKHIDNIIKQAGNDGVMVYIMDENAHIFPS